MATLKMQKVGLTVASDQAQNVLEAVQGLGKFEVVAAEQEEKNTLPADVTSVYDGTAAQVADLDFVVRYLEPSKPLATTFREKLLGQRVEGDDTTALAAARKSYKKVIAQCSELQEQESTIAARYQHIAENLAVLDAWQDLNVPLKEIHDSEEVGVRMGSVSAADRDDFVARVGEMSLVDAQVVTANEKHVFFLVLFHQSEQETLQEVCDEYRFEAFSVQGRKQTVSEEIKLLHAETKELEKNQKTIDQQKSVLAKEHLRDVKLAHDGMKWRQQQHEALELAAASESVVSLQGWVPAAEYDALATTIESVTKRADLQKIESDEEQPTVLKNDWFTRPFSTVVQFFGLPKGGEMDPTPYIAPFFAIFFGFCLTDAGYGALLTATFLTIYLLFPLERELKTSVMLLVYCGIATIFMGVLFGGYFGMTQEQLPFLVREDGMFYGQVFDPINDLVPNIMVIAYALGALQLLIGVVLAGMIHLRNKDWVQAYFVTLPTFIAVVITILWVLASQGVTLVEYKDILAYIPLGMLAILVFSMGSGNIIVRPLLGLLIVANEIIGWASVMLSYSRLFALGLATGIIALSFNQIALMAFEGLPIFLGIPAMLAILLFGHALNLGLNFIGALVHTARLHFVEFFGRFYEGGGRAFVPLRRKGHYVFDSKK